MAKISILASVVLACVVILLLLYQAGNRETLSAAQFRADSGYREAKLSDGVTAYQISGPENGPAVIIIHGGTLGPMAYQAYVPPLVKAGYRVVVYDQYGRGFSDRPMVPLSIDLMRHQLRELMDHLQIQQANLFGVSFGGAILARFGARHPERVAALAYQVPVIEGASVGLTGKLVALPIVGQFLSRFVAIPSIISRGESFGTQSEEARRVVAHFTQQFNVQGTERMMRDLLVGDALSSRMADHITIGAKGMRAQFVYATDDPEIKAEQVQAALAHYASPDVHKYTGGHFFSSGKSEALAAKLDDFFSAGKQR